MSYEVDSSGTTVHRANPGTYLGYQPCGCNVAVTLCPDGSSLAAAVAAARRHGPQADYYHYLARFFDHMTGDK